MKHYIKIVILCVLSLMAANVFAATPLSFTATPVIANMLSGATQVVTYAIRNNTHATLPLNISGIANPVLLTTVTNANDCGNSIAQGQTCYLRLSIHPVSAGTINQRLVINYNGRNTLSANIALQVFAVNSASPVAALANFTGVDYAPAHYPANDPRNDEDQANVVPEISQLQAAGFNVLRMYGEPAKTWIAVINAANNQNMQVIYQLATCESDLTGQCVQSSDTFANLLAAEITKLQNVIAQVGTTVFQKVVPLVLVGNEIYFTQGSQSNINDILTAVSQTRAITDPLNIPVSISLQADVWISSSATIHADLVSLTNALSSQVPIGINVYPFQWVVPPATSVNPPPPVPLHALSWYVSGINFPNNPILFAETGWATDGNYINGLNNTTGSLANAEIYFPLLYPYTKSHYPLLAFMAFDVPTKTVNPDLTSENFFGVFDDECNLKNSSLLPNTAYAGIAQCSNANAIFTFAGGSNAAQPAFSIQYVHGGNTYVIQVPTADRTQLNVTPWPTITLSAGDSVTLTSATSTCTNTVATTSGTHSGGTWTNPGTTGTGSGQCNAVNWVDSSQTVFMPANF